MPKILRILNRFNLGGPVYNATYLSADLSPEFDTLLIGGAAEKDEKSALYIPEAESLQPEVIPEFRRSVSPAADYRAYRSVRSIIRSYRPDIVHTHASKAGAIGRLAALHEKVPVIVHTFHGHVFHSYFNPLKTAFFKSVERYLAKRSDGVIAISAQQRNELTEQYRVVPEDKISVIPLGFDLERFTLQKNQRRIEFRNKFGIEDKEFVIGIIGRFAAVKNHRMFIDVIARLKDQSDRKIRGVIIGDGSSRGDLLEYASDKGLNTSANNEHSELIFTSWIEDVSLVLPALDLVVLTSYNEGTPVSLIEAQAAGVPVMSTDVGGIRDILIPEMASLLVVPDDSEKMSRNIMELLTDQGRLDQMAEMGCAFVHQRFTRDKLAANMKLVYNELLAHSKRSSNQ